MKTSHREWVLAGLAAGFLLSGCISTSPDVNKAEPDDHEAAELNYQLGARYYHNGKYDLARDRLLLATKLNPRFGLAYSTLGLTYEALDNIRLAEQAYDTAVRLEPRSNGIQNTYAVFLCRQGRFKDAMDHFDKAATITENDNAEVTLTNAGVCLVQKPDLIKAEEYFRRALDVRPNYGEALLQLCVLKHENNDDLHARAFMQRFLSTNKTSADVLYLAVQIEESLGDERAKTELADRLLREFPTSPEAKRILDSD